MAMYAANGTGNWNTAATWDTVAQITTVGSTINVTTAGINSETFTAPNTTNAITGCFVCMSTAAAAGRDWTLEIFQSGVATGTIATILQTDMPTPDATAPDIWVYFRFATPFTYTTVAAGAYRFQLKSTVANSGAVRNNSGATGFSILPTDDRHTTPNGANQAMIAPANCTTAVVVTVDGTTGSATGGTASASGEPNLRIIANHGIVVGGAAAKDKAKLVWDTAADATLTFQGNLVIQNGGAVQLGTSGAPQPSGFTSTLKVNATFSSSVTPYQNGYVTGYSNRILTYRTTTYSSGLGTAASPLIVADPVDWNVGDKICAAAVTNNATNYNEAENRFIITKNSSTSYVVSATKGGVEAALANTHTAGLIVNLTRGVVFENPGGGSSGITINLRLATNGDSGFSWANINNTGILAGAPSIVGGAAFSYGFLNSATYAIPVDHVVFDGPNAYGFICQLPTALTYDGLIFANSLTNSSLATCSGLGIMPTAINQTFTDPIFINNQRQGVEYRGVNCTFTDPIFNSCNKLGLANQGGFNPINAAPFNMSNPDLNCNRISAFALSGVANATVTGGSAGTKGYNTADISIQSNTANTNVLFDGFTPGSTVFVTGHTTGAVGATELLFNKLGGVANKHMWFNENGSAQATGAGLADTHVRTPGTLNIRMNPENATAGFQWEYLVLAVPGKAVQSFLFIEKNATFGTDVATVELFLPGSTVADASATVSNTTGSYLVYSVAANYAGTENLYARVRVTAKSVASGANLYIADISNGTNNIINLNTWYRGKPSSIMFEQLGDAGAVWAYLFDGTRTAQETLEFVYDNIGSGGGGDNCIGGIVP